MPVLNSGSHIMRMQMLKHKKRKQIEARQREKVRQRQHARLSSQREQPTQREQLRLRRTYSNYKGDLNEKGEYHGYGEESTVDHVYQGYWYNDKYHGQGCLYINQTGDLYDCTWKYGKIHGIGEIKTSNHTYFGYFITNQATNMLTCLRRSRRMSRYPPENQGLVFLKKKRKTISPPRYYNHLDDHLPLLVAIIITFIMLELIFY